VRSNKPKKAPKGDYAIGYARPPKANQFQPGQSGNLGGRPRGRPSLDELMLEEAARVVKFKAADKIMHMDRDRALLPKGLRYGTQRQDPGDPVGHRAPGASASCP
jgi:hypothetical protein